jgi:S1-C subfamily serine protease
MRRSLMLVAPLAMLALIAPALAGGEGCEHGASAAARAAHPGCTASKEECLKKMAEAKTAGWLGVALDRSEDGASVVSSVIPGSPAETAGFKSGDVLYALNGIAMDEAHSKQVKSEWSALKPGSTATYTVRRDGAKKDLRVTLGTMPEAVYQAMVQEHMKQHTEVAAR